MSGSASFEPRLVAGGAGSVMVIFGGFLAGATQA
jgi:hypothetical protein